MVKAGDFYLDYALLIDCLLATVMGGVFVFVNVPFVVINDKSNQLSLLSSLISTSVSLAGFILAALTIIVSLRANIKMKDIKQAETPLELIFASKHYYRIVKLFQYAITELTLCFILASVVWLFTDSLSMKQLGVFNSIEVLIISLTILRSLIVLFIILSLDKKPKEG